MSTPAFIIPTRKPVDVSTPQPKVAPIPQRTAVVDSQYNPMSSLIVHVEGSGWTVDYYSQLLGQQDESRPIDTGTIAPNQQYHRIKSFELKVTSPLMPSQNDETKEFEVTGEATVFNNLKANVGDMFTADIGDGRTGLFTVTASERISYTKDSVYNIRYRLIADLNAALEADLETKSIKRSIFYKSFIELGDNPFITEDDHQRFIKLDELDGTLCEMLIDRYWSHDAQGLAIPEQTVLSYDDYHSHYCRVVGIGSIMRPLTIYRNGDIVNDRIKTIWDLLEDMSFINFPLVHTKLNLVLSLRFSNITSVSRTICYSRYKQTVYPQGDTESSDGSFVPMLGTEFKRASNSPVAFSSSVSLTDLPTALKSKPLFHECHKDGTYVLSPAFYNNVGDSQSVLEWVTIQMLLGRAIEPAVAHALASKILYERPLEQFYYIPIILAIIYYVKRGS